MSVGKRIAATMLLAIALLNSHAIAQEADVILHNGKIVTVDMGFSIQQAMAIEGERILRVGNNAEVLKTKGAGTEVVDLDGRMVLPGLIDSHVHPVGAAMTEFDHPIPQMDTIGDVLKYVKSRVDALDDGQWIRVSQVFLTRLREQRYPTRAELDRAAPKNPVIFRTGPDASLNTLAMKLSGIDKNFKVTDGGPGHIEKDPKTGEATGIIRGCTRYVKYKSPEKQAAESDRYGRLVELFKDYNAAGLTAICDGSASPSNLDRYKKMLDNGDLTVRVAAQHYVNNIGSVEEIQARIRKVAKHPLRKGGPMLRVIGVKMFLDGGMLTGSAAMRKPWGVSKIYAITDPEYRGVLFIPRERLLPMVRAAVESGLQFNAHSVGDGAVHTLLDVYEELSKTLPVRKTRPGIVHSNFMSREAVEKSAAIGAIPIIQPAWLYLDARTLSDHFGYERLRYFQPLKSLFDASAVVAGGSDHMQKIGSLRSINPYNPFLGMWIAVTRKAKWYEGQLHSEEALSREQAICFYTINNAYALFLEDEVGSIVKGKRADCIVLDRDLLTCPVDAIKDTKVHRTYVNGKLVYKKK